MRFDVSVDDAHAVEIGNHCDQLARDLSFVSLGEDCFLAVDEVEQGPFLHILHD